MNKKSFDEKAAEALLVMFQMAFTASLWIGVIYVLSQAFGK